MSSVMLSHRPAISLILLAAFASSLPARAASSVSDADAQAGAVLFRDKGCTRCHGSGGVGTPKGPSLADIRNNKDWPPEKMADHILNGGQKMPPFREALADDEIAQLVAYLRAKNRPVPPPLPAGSDAPTAPPPNN